METNIFEWWWNKDNNKVKYPDEPEAKEEFLKWFIETYINPKNDGSGGSGGSGGDSGIPEAPNNGKQYGRQNEGWTEIDIPDLELPEDLPYIAGNFDSDSTGTANAALVIAAVSGGLSYTWTANDEITIDSDGVYGIYFLPPEKTGSTGVAATTNIQVDDVIVAHTTRPAAPAFQNFSSTTFIGKLESGMKVSFHISVGTSANLNDGGSFFIVKLEPAIVSGGGGGEGTVQSIDGIEPDNSGNVKTTYSYATEDEFNADKANIPDGATVIKLWEQLPFQGYKYSLTEQKTGEKWLDDRDIYSKTFNVGAKSFTAGNWVALATQADLGFLISGEYFGINTSGEIVSEIINVFRVLSGGVINGAATWAISLNTSYLTIRYVKGS